MNTFEKAKWIWIADGGKPDEYGEFFVDFTPVGDTTELVLSCDTDFAAYIGDTLVGFGQFPDFPHYKSVERLDLTPFVRGGNNTLRLVVWHHGAPDSSTYFPAEAGLIFEITSGAQTVAYSSKDTLSRFARGYVQHKCRPITMQVGYGFSYDACDEGGALRKSIEIEKTVSFVERPICRLTVGAPVPGVLVKTEGNRKLYDLGRETVGHISLVLHADTPCNVTVRWGEHAVDGWVRAYIHGRAFDFGYHLKAGENRFVNPLRRLGARFLEVESDAPVRVESIGLCPVEYPVEVLPFDAGSRQEIYDVGVHTLRCSMHDHYEDCPWREQALYAMDSRNQMICGYYAFREYDFALASLILMAKGQREDGLLNICAPAGGKLAIPSFSLIYPVQVLEYEEHSGRLAPEPVYEAARTIIRTYRNRMDEEHLIPSFSADDGLYWNFYEWTEGSDNCRDSLKTPGAPKRYDALLQTMYLRAEEAWAKLAQRHGESDARDLAATVLSVRHHFLRADGLYRLSRENENSTQLLCALAILSGVATAEETPALVKAIKGGDLVEASLSMSAFVYDALLFADKENAAWILKDIDGKYGYMLSMGATTFWETVKGEQDFSTAGSLCHGWSAMPVYYFHKFRALGIL